MTTAFRHLSRRALERLDAGLQQLLAGDPQVSRTQLAQEARACLARVQPLRDSLERYDRVLGTVGFAVFLLALGAGFVLLSALDKPSLATAYTSGMTTAVCGSLLLAASVMTHRIELAVELANDVLDELGR